jgi:glycosyltransferase involved in cell wall biosynthesis
MGRLHPIKGADRLLRAFERVASHFPAALLVLAGPDEFSIERSFRTGVSDAGLADRVRFPGMVQGEIKRALLERSDLFCLPSDAEGFSMAILEALAHATPVLISPRCHFPDVERFHAGRIAAVDDEALAGALAEMLAQPQRLVAMGEAGRTLVAERYTWEAAASSMIAAYEEGIERHSRAHQGTASPAT